MIQKNETWELVDRHEDRRVIGVKWCSEQSSMPMAPSTNTRPDSLSEGMHRFMVLINLTLLLLLPDCTPSD